MRIGRLDVHPLVPGATLIIGGVEIAHPADCGGIPTPTCCARDLRRLLGASRPGRHRPGNSRHSDARYAGIDSRKLLREVKGRLDAENMKIMNIDATIIAQAPRNGAAHARMIANIAPTWASPRAINLKATTTEELGAIGRGEGIAAQAIALID